VINIIVTIFVGFFVGVLARFFYPGAVEMGFIWTTILGIAGSVLAGLVVSRGGAGFHRAGFFASIVGGIVLIFLGHVLHIGG
jgi:uncharacterized membrane protein YeaQ/YmgE (transglycosylase-associated protein family)